MRHVLALTFLAALVVGCADHEGAANPTGHLPGPSTIPSPTPTPTPTPLPTPSPTPTPIPEVRTLVTLFQRQMECKPGVTPPKQVNPFKVGCSIEVRVDVVDRHGVPIPVNVTGNDVTWEVQEGASRLTLPWDENPRHRWMTALSPGPYRIVATLSMKRTHEKIAGELSGEFVE